MVDAVVVEEAVESRVVEGVVVLTTAAHLPLVQLKPGQHLPLLLNTSGSLLQHILLYVMSCTVCTSIY